MLKGYAADRAGVDQARELAATVDGVERVSSLLEVSPTMSKFLP